MFRIHVEYIFLHTDITRVFAYTIVFFVIWKCAKILRLAFNQDLREIPGPRLSAFTVWPLKLAVLSGRRTLYIHALHEQYGSFVRIGPSEISIADFPAWRIIHRPGSDFRKNPGWYQRQSPAQVDDNTCGVFGLVDPKVASARRRLLLTAGTRKIVSEWETHVSQLVSLTIQKMKHDIEINGDCDVMKWWTLQAADVSAELAFGEGFSNVANGKKSEMIEDIEATMPLIGVRLELPIIYEIFMSLPLPASRQFKQLFKRYEVYGGLAISNTRNASKGPTKTLFSRMVPEDGTQHLTDEVVKKEAANVLIAGTDTTAMTLTYLTYAVLKNDEIKRRLVEEVKAVPDWPTWEQLEELPLLHNVIRETWRRYPAIPGSLPRVVPAEGAQFGRVRIPGDTVVSTQAYTFHLDPTIFPDPLRFNPDRWLNPTPGMKEHIMVFGGPARLCLGQNVAKLQLFHSVFRFFRECGQTKLAARTTEHSMTMVDYFTIKPKAGNCIIEAAE